MDFGVSNWILGNLAGNNVHFRTYYTYSTCLWCKWERLAILKDTWRGNEVIWICFGHPKLLSHVIWTITARPNVVGPKDKLSPPKKRPPLRSNLVRFIMIFTCWTCFQNYFYHEMHSLVAKSSFFFKVSSQSGQKQLICIVWDEL